MIKAPRVHARLAFKILNDLKRQNFSVDAALKEAGIRRADLGDPDSRVSYACVIALMERAATMLGEPEFGLRLGASQDISDSGHPGLRRC